MSQKRKSVAEICYDLALPITESLNLILWDVRYVKEGASWYLRVYIDKDEEAVSLDDCSEVSRQLDPILDKADPIKEAYCLEVCSPGIERELTRHEHFESFIGQNVKVKLVQPMDDLKEIDGQLISHDENGVVLKNANDNEVFIDKINTSKIHVLVDWDKILS